jgi:hypothetical protein
MLFKFSEAFRLSDFLSSDNEDLLSPEWSIDGRSRSNWLPFLWLCFNELRLIGFLRADDCYESSAPPLPLFFSDFELWFSFRKFYLDPLLSSSYFDFGSLSVSSFKFFGSFIVFNRDMLPPSPSSYSVTYS